MIVEVGDKKKILDEKIMRLMVLMNIIPYKIGELILEHNEEEYVGILNDMIDALIKLQDEVKQAYYSIFSQKKLTVKRKKHN